MMHKIWLIIKREYLVRVRKKSFIIMTILGPILMAALLIVPTYLAEKNQENSEKSHFIDNIPFGIEDAPKTPLPGRLIFGLSDTPDSEE